MYSDPFAKCWDFQFKEHLEGACRSLDGMTLNTQPVIADAAIEHVSAYDHMPGLSPIPFNAAMSSYSVASFRTNVLGLTYGSFFSQIDCKASDKDRSDCSALCFGRGQLHHALSKGSPLSFVEDLLKVNNGETKLRDNDGLTPLHFALKMKAPIDDAVLAVLAHDPLVSKWQDSFGKTPCENYSVDCLSMSRLPCS
jgi:hypothetical protein